jgi:hypothetical protein
MENAIVKALFEQTKKSNKMDFNVNETLSLLHYGKNLNIVMSWGVSYFVAINEKNYLKFSTPFKIPQLHEKDAYQKGLALKVHAHRHKGYVLITLNGGDYYDVDLISTRGNIKKQFTDLCFDELVQTIDKEIEYVDTYKY